MNQETCDVAENSSQITELGGLIISVTGFNDLGVSAIIGRPGLPNVETRLSLSQAVLFETPDEGMFEVRLFHISEYGAKFLISHISPKPGLTAGFVDDDPSNKRFTAEEISRIPESLKSVKEQLAGHSDISSEQLEFISRKLDEMSMASERLGKKDWKNWVIGTLTSIAVSTALSTDAGRALFTTVDDSLSWMFKNTMQLLT